MKSYDRLLKVMEEQAECYERIRQQKRKERQCILERNYSALNDNVASVEKLCWQLDNLEKEREIAVADLSKSFGGENIPEEMTVSEISSEMEDPSSLRNISDNLSGLLEEVQQLNFENSYLLNNSLDTVGEVLGALLSEITETNVAYTDRGVSSGSFGQSGLVNKKA